MSRQACLRRRHRISRSRPVPLSQLVVALTSGHLSLSISLLLKLLLLLYMLLCPLLLLSKLRLAHVPCRGSVIAWLLLRLLPLLLFKFSLLLPLCCPAWVSQRQTASFSHSLSNIRVRSLTK